MHCNASDGYHIIFDKVKYTLDETNPGKSFKDKLQGVTAVYYDQEIIAQEGFEKIKESLEAAGVALSLIPNEDSPVSSNDSVSTAGVDDSAAAAETLVIDYDLGIGVKDNKTPWINFLPLIEKGAKLPYKGKKYILNCYYETDSYGNVTIPLYKRDDPNIKLILDANYGPQVELFGQYKIEGMTDFKGKVLQIELDYEMEVLEEIIMTRSADRDEVETVHVLLETIVR